MSDAASVLSLDPSINFDFDAIIMKHPAYIGVYGDRPLPPLPKVPTKRTPPPIPDRALKPPVVPPRPPPRRRKPVWNPYLGQAVDVGTITRTDSSETVGLIEEPVDVKAIVQNLPTEERFRNVPTTGEDSGRAIGVLDEQEGAKATEKNVALEQDHETIPTVMEPLGSSESTLHVLPQPVVTVPAKVEEKETSLSAADGLRGEMDLAFGVSEQLRDIEREHSLSSTSPKLSAETQTLIPDDKENTVAFTASPQSPAVLGDLSGSLSKQHGTDDFVNSPPDQDETHDSSSREGPDPTGDVVHDESPEHARPSSIGSNLYSATTKSASPASVTGNTELSPINGSSMSLQVAAIDTKAQEVTAIAPVDMAQDRHSNSNRSSVISNHLSKTTVFEELNPDSRHRSDPDEMHIPSQSNEANENAKKLPEQIAPSGLGLEPRDIQEFVSSEIIRQDSVKSNMSPAKIASPPPPRRRPPIPPAPPTLTPVLFASSSQTPATPTSAATASDISSLPSSSQRDSSTFNTSSTVSSSEFPEVNTAASIQYSTTPTAATSLDIATTASIREQAQFKLRNLHSALAAAKARGDSKSQADAIQDSIEVILRTYLAPPAEPPVESSSQIVKSPSPKLKNRASILRFPSMGSSSKGLSLGNAAATGDVTKLAKLLEEKVNADLRGPEYKTPLMRAAINGHIKCLEVLKAFGADELAVDKMGFTVLHHAIASNNLSAIKWLLEAYPPPRPDMIRHRSSILLRATDAAKWGRTQKNLREASDTEGSRPLHVAVEKDMGGVLNILLAADVDIEAKDNHGQTPLHRATIVNRRDSFDTLLRHGANINAVDGHSLTPLHWAARCGRIDVIETLLEKGAARWEYDGAGFLPIHQAAWEGHLPSLEAILTERADLDRVTKYGETLLHLCMLSNKQDVVEYLLKNMVDINPWVARHAHWNHAPYTKLIGSSLTPLHYACCLGHFELAYLLLDKEAYVNASTPDGYTPLMMAVEAGNTDMVSLLHRRGAKVNASLPGNMMTALHMASKRGDLETVRELCRAGADWKALAGKESYKRTPAQEADFCTDKTKRQEVREYLNTIHVNQWNKYRYNTAVENNARANRAALLPAQQPVNYVSWGQQTNNSYRTPTYPVQHAQTAPASQWTNGTTYMNEFMRPPPGQRQYFDPTAYEMQIDSPPPYQPGNNVSARLASQPPVHRPKYS
ncbi:hypothetical protein P7C71_g1778, partial [Lecanoromycetidae sp. Uapishka_2]